MRTFRLRAPSPAVTVSVVALAVALGGTSYAAFTLPENSVGTKQLKHGAVTSNKIAQGAVTGSKMNFDGVTVPNATNAADATNASHATSADDSASLAGTPASSYVQFGSTLPSGDTETGVWGTAGGSSTGGYDVAGFRFYPVLPATLGSSRAVFTTSTASHCPGPGHADPGYLCVYGEADFNAAFKSIGTGSGATGASTSGAVVFFNVTGGSSYAQGYWAVTAQ
jgi:hypothetical protein